MHRVMDRIGAQFLGEGVARKVCNERPRQTPLYVDRRRKLSAQNRPGIQLSEVKDLN